MNLDSRIYFRMNLNINNQSTNKIYFSMYDMMYKKYRIFTAVLILRYYNTIYYKLQSILH